MLKNVASQKLVVYAYDSTTGLPETGDAANLTAYESLDYGAVTILTDTSATEMSSSNAAGYYLFDLTQAETNANTILFSAKSSTANIVVVGVPARCDTVVQLADGVAHGGTLGSSTATLALSRCSIVSQSSNTSALTVTGNGTGNGGHFTSGAGATSDGLRLVAGSTNGSGLACVGAGTGHGAALSAGADGNGLRVIGGGTTGYGVNITSSASGYPALVAIAGASVGAYIQGSDYGIRAIGGTAGILAQGNYGALFQATVAAGAGLYCLGNTTGSGALFQGGATGNGATYQAGATSWWTW